MSQLQVFVGLGLHFTKILKRSFQLMRKAFQQLSLSMECSADLSVHENVGVDVDGRDLDGDVVLQLALGCRQLLVSRLRPPQVVVKNL